MLSVTTDSPWEIVKNSSQGQKVKKTKSDTTGFVAAKGSVRVGQMKRKHDIDEVVQSVKKVKLCGETFEEFQGPHLGQ